MGRTPDDEGSTVHHFPSFSALERTDEKDINFCVMKIDKGTCYIAVKTQNNKRFPIRPCGYSFTLKKNAKVDVIDPSKDLASDKQTPSPIWQKKNITDAA